MPDVNSGGSVAIDTFLIAADKNGQLLTSESQINATGIVDPLPNRPDLSRGLFEIEDFSTDIVQAVTMGAPSTGLGTGKVTFSPLRITRTIDKQSPTLFLDLCQGTSLKYVDILQRKAGVGTGQVFLVRGFGTVLLSDLSWSYDGETATESVTLQYGEAWIAYRPQNPDGSMGQWIIKGWNRITNTPEP
jgi:type VI protein secretion system component Hcp